MSFLTAILTLTFVIFASSEAVKLWKKTTCRQRSWKEDFEFQTSKTLSSATLDFSRLSKCNGKINLPPLGKL